MPGSSVLATLEHLWKALAALQVPAAVMGGLALSVWKHVRTTRDVDVLVDIGNMTVEEFIDKLTAVGFRPRREPPLMLLDGWRLLQLIYEPPGTFVELHVELFLADTPYQKTALARRVTAQLSSMSVVIAVLSCEDLILHKLISGRIIDRADVLALLRENRPALDMNNLTNWIKQLKLEAEWHAVWREAFPQEPVPG